jgi:hypothetical protein
MLAPVVFMLALAVFFHIPFSLSVSKERPIIRKNGWLCFAEKVQEIGF